MTVPAPTPVAVRDAVQAIVDWNSHLLPAARQAKYSRLRESPFVFYRGTNHLFWADVANDPRLREFGDARTRTWLKGDMHAENLGAFCNNQGCVVYDFNDFDDAVIADYQYDLWRMAVSLVLVARQNGLDPADDARYLHAFAASYLHTMAGYADNDLATTLHFTRANVCKRLRKFLEAVEKKQSAKALLDKWTRLSADGRHFPPSSRLAPVSEAERAALLAAMPAYGQTLSGALTYDPALFEVLDMAHRLEAGTGSLGNARYYLLIEGASDDPADHVILDVKQQTKPTPYHYLSDTERANYDNSFSNDADRHAHAYHALTNSKTPQGEIIYADDFLGWLELDGKAFSVRKRSPYKKTYPTIELDSPKRLARMAEQWAVIMATAHSRAFYFDQTLLPGPVAAPIMALTAGREQAFATLLTEIARCYAAQVLADWEDFCRRVNPAAESPPSAFPLQTHR